MKFVGILGILRKHWEGIRYSCFGEGITRYSCRFFRFSQNTKYVRITLVLVRIVSNTLGYFGILWNTLNYFGILCGIPVQKMEYQRVLLYEYFFRTPLFEYHSGIPMEYLRIPGYSRYPTTYEYLAKTVEYY